MSSDSVVVPLAQSSGGRVSGKPWKAQKSATVYEAVHYHLDVHLNFTPRRSHLPEGVKTKGWQDRMEKTKKAQAIKKLQQELKDEKQAELQR